MTEQKNIETVLSKWRAETCVNTSRSRLDVEIFTHQILREVYPNCAVVRTAPAKSDLLAFAAAGHASATRSNVGHDAARAYCATQTKLKGDVRKLEDIVSFACWSYHWQRTDFIVYEEAYISRFGQNIKRLYLLTPYRSETLSVDVAKREANDSIDNLLAASGQWTREPHDEVWVFDNAQWTKSSSLWQDVQETAWDDIVLSEAFKLDLQRDVHGFFDSRGLFGRLRIPWKRGIIFHGPPGNGKSMVIRAIMSSLSARSTKVQTLYVKSLDACGGPKWSLQQIFQKARRSAPCLLVLEDLDTLVADSTRTYFLNEVDGVESNDGILIIGTTNHLDQLDPSVSHRPSRFDRHYHFAEPARSERLAYCHIWRSRYEGVDGMEFPSGLCDVIVEWTEGYSFAYMKELFTASLLLFAIRTINGSACPVAEMNDSTVEYVKPNGQHGSEAPTGIDPAMPYLPPDFQKNIIAMTLRSQARALSGQIKASTTVAKIPKAPAGQPQIRMPIISPLDQNDH